MNTKNWYVNVPVDFDGEIHYFPKIVTATTPAQAKMAAIKNVAGRITVEADDVEVIESEETVGAIVAPTAPAAVLEINIFDAMRIGVGQVYALFEQELNVQHGIEADVMEMEMTAIGITDDRKAVRYVCVATDYVIKGEV